MGPDRESASKACGLSMFNAITLAFAIELEPAGIKVNAGYEGTETVEEGAAEAVRTAMLGPDGPTGTFTRTGGVIPW